jgi:hypothetical protein
MFELKLLSPESVGAALEKALRYRLLNEPREAESICRDIIEVDPKNHEALTTLILALTDQLATKGAKCGDEARSLLPRLGNEYEEMYYAGLICERRANAHLSRRNPEGREDSARWKRRRDSTVERLRSTHHGERAHPSASGGRLSTHA